MGLSKLQVLGAFPGHRNVWSGLLDWMLVTRLPGAGEEREKDSSRFFARERSDLPSSSWRRSCIPKKFQNPNGTSQMWGNPSACPGPLLRGRERGRRVHLAVWKQRGPSLSLSFYGLAAPEKPPFDVELWRDQTSCFNGWECSSEKPTFCQ